MKQAYIERAFKPQSLKMIKVIDAIARDYMRQGFVLTVRQLYYQLVARGIIPNTERSYQNTTVLVNDARMAGMVDWDAIEDRTRSFIRRTRWESGAAIVEACVESYHEDRWDNQERRVFVIVEKEALAGVLEGVCQRYDVPLLAARGYPSGTVLREFTLSDLVPAIDAGQSALIIHLGDHDPSGIDMTRDLRSRVETFAEGSGSSIELDRIALNMPQIEEQKPPENPAKTTDSRFNEYRARYGESSWELDALTPQYLNRIVETTIVAEIDNGRWKASQARIDAVKKKLAAMAKQF